MPDRNGRPVFGEDLRRDITDVFRNDAAMEAFGVDRSTTVGDRRRAVNGRSGVRWTIVQQCSACGWTLLDESCARSDVDEAVGQDCEGYLGGDGEHGSCGPCDVLVMASINDVADWLKHVDRMDDVPGARFAMPRFNPLWDAAEMLSERVNEEADDAR